MTRSLRVLIADDEPLARRLLLRLLGRDEAIGEIRQCSNGMQTSSEIRLFRPHILFLDIEMPGLSGIDVCGSLPHEHTPVTVFTTAHSEHAVKAFELQACDYLLKPFDEARFATALGRAKSSVAATPTARKDPKLPVRVGDRTVLIDPVEVDYISSDDNYVRIQVGARAYLHRTTLDNAELVLRRSNFIRVHRRFLVNSAKIKELRRRNDRAVQIVCLDGARIPVSRRYQSRLQAFLEGR